MRRLELNPSLGIPIYRQLMDQIRGLIAAGQLQPGDQLPSIRELSVELRINPASAVKAYSELRHLGIVVQDQGRGTFIHASAAATHTDREALLQREAAAYVAKASAWGFSSSQLKKAVERAVTDAREHDAKERNHE